MDYKLFQKIPVQVLFRTAECNYLFEGYKVFEYQTVTDLLNGRET